MVPRDKVEQVACTHANLWQFLDTSLDLMLLNTDSSYFLNKGIIVNDLGNISILISAPSAGCWLEVNY